MSYTRWTATELQQWLDERGFPSEHLKGVTGSDLDAISDNELIQALGLLKTRRLRAALEELDGNSPPLKRTQFAEIPLLDISPLSFSPRSPSESISPVVLDQVTEGILVVVFGHSGWPQSVLDLQTALVFAEKNYPDAVVTGLCIPPYTNRGIKGKLDTFLEENQSVGTVHVLVSNHGMLSATEGVLWVPLSRLKVSCTVIGITEATNLITSAVLAATTCARNRVTFASLFFDACWSARNVADSIPLADGSSTHRWTQHGTTDIGGHYDDPLAETSLDAWVDFRSTQCH